MGLVAEIHAAPVAQRSISYFLRLNGRRLVR
jgi:hypothetical protein